MQKVSLFGFVAFFLLVSAQAFALTIDVYREVPLNPSERGTFRTALYFDQDRPGEISQDRAIFGCALLVEADRPVLPAGRYFVNFESENSPDRWDSRWWRQLIARPRGLDLRVSCQARRRIPDSYMNWVMNGHVGVSRW